MKKQVFKITPEIKQTLCQELDAFFKLRGLDHWKKKRQSKTKTGLPISWRNIWILNNHEPQDIELSADLILSLFSFFGYELTFKFTKPVNNE